MSTRSLARVWLREHVVGPRVLALGVDLGCERSDLDVTTLAAGAPGEAVERQPAVDTVVLGSLGDAASAALERLRDGGRAIAVLPGTEGFRELFDLLHPRVRPHVLRVQSGSLWFAGTRCADASDAWREFLARGALVDVLDAALRDRAHAELRQVATRMAEAERTTAGMRALALQAAQLEAVVERTRRSARYRIGAAVAALTRRPWHFVPDLLAIRRDRIEGEAAARERELGATDALLARFARASRTRGSDTAVVSYTALRRAATRVGRQEGFASALVAAGIPVLLTQLRDEPDAPRAERGDPSLLRVPEDWARERFEAIARADLGAPRRILLVSHPRAEVVRALDGFRAQGWLTVYDALDDWSAFAAAGMASWFSAAAERFLVANADCATAVSRPLAAKLSRACGERPVAVLPNALDPGFVPPGFERRPADPAVVGYFGHLAPAWFDWEALEAIATRRPQLAFEVVGFGGAPAHALPRNVALLGPRRPAELPAIAARWRAAILPFRIGALADAVDPLKVYQYLSLGLPTVSFRMPQIADYPYVTTVESVDDFVAALDRAVVSLPERAVLERFLAANTWACRVDALLALAQRPPVRDDGAGRAVCLRTDAVLTGIEPFLEAAALASLAGSDRTLWVCGGQRAPAAVVRTMLELVDAQGAMPRFRWWSHRAPDRLPDRVLGPDDVRDVARAAALLRA